MSSDEILFHVGKKYVQYIQTEQEIRVLQYRLRNVSEQANSLIGRLEHHDEEVISYDYMFSEIPEDILNRAKDAIKKYHDAERELKTYLLLACPISPNDSAPDAGN